MMVRLRMVVIGGLIAISVTGCGGTTAPETSTPGRANVTAAPTSTTINRAQETAAPEGYPGQSQPPAATMPYPGSLPTVTPRGPEPYPGVRPATAP